MGLWDARDSLGGQFAQHGRAFGLRELVEEFLQRDGYGGGKSGESLESEGTHGFIPFHTRFISQTCFAEELISKFISKIAQIFSRADYELQATSISPDGDPSCEP